METILSNLNSRVTPEQVAHADAICRDVLQSYGNLGSPDDSRMSRVVVRLNMIAHEVAGEVY